MNNVSVAPDPKNSHTKIIIIAGKRVHRKNSLHEICVVFILRRKEKNLLKKSRVAMSIVCLEIFHTESPISRFSKYSNDLHKYVQCLNANGKTNDDMFSIFRFDRWILGGKSSVRSRTFHLPTHHGRARASRIAAHRVQQILLLSSIERIRCGGR